MISITKKLIGDKGWEECVRAETMDMSDLSGLKDEMFTHSITCMCVFAFSDPVKGIREIYRMLQVGGTAVVMTWKD
jgi:ubiquinone/menaquinone biosynthesis C-methylase UbiE